MKANPERGEAPLIVVRDGVEHEYVLKLHGNSVAALEGRRQSTFADIMGKAEAMHITSIIDVLYAFLQKHHSNDIKSLSAAADLMDEYGGPIKVLKAIGAVLTLNAPEGATNPPTAPARTGGDSSLTPAA